MTPRDLAELSGLNLAERTRQLLEDFVVVATAHDIALVKNDPRRARVADNVTVALIASTLRLSSLDWARKRYFKPATSPETTDAAHQIRDLYVAVYKYVKEYILRLMGKLDPKDDAPLPSMGVFGASVVLTRLSSSFFAAHLLYSLGQRYEGHAVSRLILEQLAWAHAAYPLTELSEIKGVVTTKAISGLAKTLPYCGKLYGFLSKKAHIDYSSHRDFLHIENARNVVDLTHSAFAEYAKVLLCLGDAFGVVWEMSQREYLEELETISVEGGKVLVRATSPFREVGRQYLSAIRGVARGIDKGSVDSLDDPW